MTPHESLLKTIFWVLHRLPQRSVLQPKTYERPAFSLDSFYSLIFERPSLGRAPPKDSVLLSA